MNSNRSKNEKNAVVLLGEMFFWPLVGARQSRRGMSHPTVYMPQKDLPSFGGVRMPTGETETEEPPPVRVSRLPLCWYSPEHIYGISYGSSDPTSDDSELVDEYEHEFDDE